MRNVWIFARKEFLLNVRSSRFVVGLLLCLVIVLFTMIVSVSDYQIQKEVCEAEARQAGRKAVIAEDAAAREAMLDDREARMQAIDNEIAQLDAQQQAAEEEFYAATQSYTEAEAMGMDEETLGQLDARMNEIGARLMALYDRREALQNPEAYEARRKAELSRQETESLIERELRCPECGYKAGTVFSDCRGHMTIRCRKCKTTSVLNLAYFRRKKGNRRSYRLCRKPKRTTE